MIKNILTHLTILLCIVFISGTSIDALAGTKNANFKVSSRGTIDYTVDVPQNAGSLKISVQEKPSCNDSIYGNGNSCARSICARFTWFSICVR